MAPLSENVLKIVTNSFGHHVAFSFNINLLNMQLSSSNSTGLNIPYRE